MPWGRHDRKSLVGWGRCRLRATKADRSGHLGDLCEEWETYVDEQAAAGDDKQATPQATTEPPDEPPDNRDIFGTAPPGSLAESALKGQQNAERQVGRPERSRHIPAGGKVGRQEKAPPTDDMLDF